MDYEQAEALMSDVRFQELRYRQDKPNVFSIVGQTHTEHWHSAFMQWLLEPDSSLGLGCFPLERLLGLAMIRKPDCGLTIQDVFRLRLNDVHFETEKTFPWKGGKRSIDVYGESSELIIVIENKVRARENYNSSATGQTQDYYEYVEKNKKPGQKVLYFFITPKPGQRAFSQAYIHITYQEMYDYLIARCISHPKVREEGRYLLEQYAGNLREIVGDSPMALVNTDLCRSLYGDYEKELKEIFDTVQSAGAAGNQEMPCVLYRQYQSVFDEIYLSLVDEFGTTPNARFTNRQHVTFNDLYQAGLVEKGMKFYLQYDGETYQARIMVLGEQECRLQVLDREGKEFRDSDGAITGMYKLSSPAALDIINIYRKQAGKKTVTSLDGPKYWKTKEGKTIAEFVSQYAQRPALTD